ncbi:MAG: hypothetical protein R3330_18020, partial [Saprospiraceae bacterium]|nr:hypothetical protein [Saprospiraceae bacterium]
IHSDLVSDSTKSTDLSWSVHSSEGCADTDDSLKAAVDIGNGTVETDYIFMWSPDWTRRQVVRRVDPQCSSCGTEFSYGPNGMRSNVGYANGVEDAFIHDSRGNVIRREIGVNTSLNQITVYDFDPSFNLPTSQSTESVVDNTKQRTIAYHYDSSGNLDSMVTIGLRTSSDTLKYTYRYEYNGNGQLIFEDGPRDDTDADTITYTYNDDTGDLATRTLSNGNTTTFGARNALGLRTWIRSPNGDTTRFTFNDRGRLASITYASHTADSTVISLTYDVDGNLTSVNNLTGSGLELSYTGSGFVDAIVDELDSYIQYTHDSVGNAIAESIYDADSTLRRWEDFVYDEKRRLELLISPYNDTTRMAYDAIGNL